MYESVLGFGLFFTAICARIFISKAAFASSVDQHYWQIAAKAYREQRGLPVKILGKYLMESVEQAYPPLFGILLGRVLSKSLVKHATLGLELVEFLGLAGLMLALGLPLSGIIVALAFYASAPILIVYNTQLTPRILGDLFLFGAMASQVVATSTSISYGVQLFFLGLSAVLLALMLMTHKMTYQLHFVLLPFWAWALQSWGVLLATVGGALIYLIFVGFNFAELQFKAHFDIVRFWNKHWRELGSHQFLDSPVYGLQENSKSSCFHTPGLGGIIKHISVIVSYAPFVMVLPICSLLSETWPPTWLLVWLFITYIWVTLTLFVSPLKCLGGGHLYVFNAVVPGSIYVGYLPETMAVVICLGFAGVLTVAALYFGWKTVKNRPMSRGTDFEDVVNHLKHLPVSKIAVFPLQAAEPIAALTDHAVLWGGHGLGFENLEGFYPVLNKKLNYFVDKYQIDMVVWDVRFWENGQKVLNEELSIELKEIQRFGAWCLAPIVNHIQ